MMSINRTTTTIAQSKPSKLTAKSTNNIKKFKINDEISRICR